MHSLTIVYDIQEVNHQQFGDFSVLYILTQSWTEDSLLCTNTTPVSIIYYLVPKPK